MDKICRSAATFYRLPRINLTNNLRFTTPASSQVNCWNQLIVRHYTAQKPPANQGLSSKVEQAKPIADILEREIQDESAELNQRLSTDQFPGFSVETDGSDVKLSKQVGNSNVTVRFTVSSSLNEWPADNQDSEQQQQQQQQQQEGGDLSMTLLSMPEFQVQISKNNHTLELSCYFEDMESDEETNEPYSMDPIFGIDELVMYEGEPKETEFAVNAEYFQEDLQTALIQYLADHGIDDEFAKNLVSFATSYEKKQYIGLMKRLKNFVSK